MVLADTQYIPKKEREQESVLTGENRIHVTMLPKQELIRVGEGRNRHFKWYTQTEELSEAYVDTIQKYEGKCAKKGTKYVERVDMNAFPAYECGKKTVCVPYGVDNKDQVHSISFVNENLSLSQNAPVRSTIDSNMLPLLPANTRNSTIRTLLSFGT